MTLPEIVALSLLTAGAAAILRFIWLDTVALERGAAAASASPVVSRPTVRRLALEAEAARVRAELESSPRAA